MIPTTIRQPADVVMWHNTAKSKLQNKIINTFSQKIPGDPYGYSHGALITKEIRLIVHSAPPRAKIETLKGHVEGIQLELWRYKGITETHQNQVVENFMKIAFKNGKGRLYDWLAIASLGRLHNAYKLHCIETIAIAFRDAEMNVYPRYLINSVLQPNQMMLANKFNLIYREAER